MVFLFPERLPRQVVAYPSPASSFLSCSLYPAHFFSFLFRLVLLTLISYMRLKEVHPTINQCSNPSFFSPYSGPDDRNFLFS